ncbi:AAA family ATPase [Vibrio sp.]|uniref:AAA family ATPase n=1 Tax=Vibrio sp. TaxID=678 RepID=UPI003D0DB461
MKPIKLTIQAFGPFADRQLIEFDKLGSAPLFLINGPTGSGKSTILDAICFGLYGETTGSERTGDQMRSDLAPVELSTVIEFEFSLADRVYRIIRSPEQYLPKLRGEGLTKKAHSCQLLELSGAGQEILLANKPKPVADAITDLIGLDVKQFRQVMVLPQGRFRELLTANSKDREQIFGQLFQTQIYNAIERALFEKAAGIRNAKQEFDNQIKGALDVVHVDSEEQLQNQLRELEPKVEQAQKLLAQSQQHLDNAQAEEKSAQQLTAQFEKRRQTQKQIQHLESQKPEIDQAKQRYQMAEKANKLELPYTQWQQAQQHQTNSQQQVETTNQHLSQAKRQLQHAQQENQQFEARRNQLPNLNKQVYQLESYRKQLVELSAYQQQLKLANQQLNSAKQQLEQTTHLRLHLEQQLQHQQQQLNSAAQQLAELPAVKAKREQLQHQLKVCQEIAQTAHAKTQIEANHNAAQSAYEGAREDTLRAKQSADQLEFRWHTTQAAQLAKQLADGEACPVCGSLDHPHLAQFDGDEVTKQQVDAARHGQQNLVAIQEQRLQEWQLAKEQLARVEQALQGWQAQLKDNQLSTDTAVLSAELEQVQQQQSLLEKLDLQKLQQQVEQSTQQAQQAALTLEQQQKGQQQAELEQNKLQSLAASLAGQLPEDLQTLDAVDQQLSSVNSEIATIQQRDVELKQINDRMVALHTTAEANVVNANQQLDKSRTELSDKQVLWQQALAESDFIGLDQYHAARLTTEQMSQLAEQIREYEQQASKLDGALEAINQELAEQCEPDVEQFSQRRTAAWQAYQQSQADLSALKSQQTSLIQVQQRLEKLYQQNLQLEQQYQVVGTLSDIANGKTGAKVSLHRFVLGVLLDDVLIQASQRLRMMSKGRYELRRKEERAKGNAGSGLDLVVEDGYSGKLRDVATLSGGESFMAALSLALGLSDVVQSYSGGIRLDTLFIDEGFGSLDPESLDLAINMLIELQQGGRTIGIISHVSELKEQMSLRIDVEPSRTGSDIQLVY